MANKLVRTYSTAGSKFPLQVTASQPSLQLFPGPAWQVGSVYSTIVPVVVPAFTGATDLTFSVPLPFPKVSLPKGASATALVSVNLAALPPQSQPIFGMPYLTLLSSGSTVQSSQQGVSSFTFQQGRTYQGFALQVDVRGYSPTNVAHGTINFSVTAVLLGQPPS